MNPNDPDASDLKLIAQDEEVFSEVVRLIATSREKAIQSVNTALIELYWEAGAMISRKIAAAEWGGGVVDQRWLSSSRERCPLYAALPAGTCSK